MPTRLAVLGDSICETEGSSRLLCPPHSSRLSFHKCVATLQVNPQVLIWNECPRSRNDCEEGDAHSLRRHLEVYAQLSWFVAVELPRPGRGRRAIYQSGFDRRWCREGDEATLA